MNRAMHITNDCLSSMEFSEVTDDQDLDAALRSATKTLTDQLIDSRNVIDAGLITAASLSDPGALARLQAQLANYSINIGIVSSLVKKATSGIETLVKG